MCYSKPKIPKPPPPPPPPPPEPVPTAETVEQDPALVSAQSKAARLGLSQLRIPIPFIGGINTPR